MKLTKFSISYKISVNIKILIVSLQGYPQNKSNKKSIKYFFMKRIHNSFLSASSSLASLARASSTSADVFFCLCRVFFCLYRVFFCLCLVFFCLCLPQLCFAMSDLSLPQCFLSLLPYSLSASSSLASQARASSTSADVTESFKNI